jgi:hypothetical protein
MFNAELTRLKTEYVRLSAKDQTFALSLLQQQARTGGLSNRQWPWVKKLVDRLDHPQETSGPRNLGDQTQLRAMFATAGEKIKFPHLLLRHDRDGYAETLKVWIAGARSMQPGSFSVTTTAVAREWLGRVMQDGTWTPGHTRTAAEYDSVASLLSELIAAPHAFLASNGKSAGACCYCGTELTDARSVEAGYGPTCAKKWGLPWGGAK